MQKNYYAIIPANVRYDEDLTPNAKLLYGEITALCNELGYCWASNAYFADLYKVSKVSVSNWINQLVEKGYIQSELQYKEGTKEIFKRYLTIVNTPIKEKFNRYETKVNDPVKENFNTPIKEKFKDNNTFINNTINNISIQQEAEQFSSWWNLYNKKQGKAKCEPKFKALVKKYGYEVIEEGTKRYLEYLKTNNIDKQFQKNPFTFLNGEHFNDEYETNTKSNKQPIACKPFEIDFNAGEEIPDTMISYIK